MQWGGYEDAGAYEEGFAAALAGKRGPFLMMTPMDRGFYRGWHDGRRLK